MEQVPRSPQRDPNTRELLTTIHTTPPALYDEVIRVLQQRLLISMEDWERLEAVWGDDIWDNLLLMAKAEKSSRCGCSSGTYIGYAKATEEWWSPSTACSRKRGLCDRPVYFVSSNTHALTNLLGGSILRAAQHIEEFIRNSNDPELMAEYDKLVKEQVRSNMENMLYYASRRFFN